MSHSRHCSAKPSHYDADASAYDLLNEGNAVTINRQIEKVLKAHKVKRVADLTCGTGSQVFWLAQRGYQVVGSDINSKMLRIARSKGQKARLSIPFIEGDMRTIQLGKFDAALTIFNSVGHLTKRDFEKAMRNIYQNLLDGGLYIFDIFNLNYLIQSDHITKLTIDWLKQTKTGAIREIQYSTISKDGVLASYTTSYVQVGTRAPNVCHQSQTLQIYSAEQLRDMLSRVGFSVLRQCDVDGSKLIDGRSERILTIARKE